MEITGGVFALKGVSKVNLRRFPPRREPVANASDQASQQGRQPRPGAPLPSPLPPGPAQEQDL